MHRDAEQPGRLQSRIRAANATVQTPRRRRADCAHKQTVATITADIPEAVVEGEADRVGLAHRAGDNGTAREVDTAVDAGDWAQQVAVASRDVEIGPVYRHTCGGGIANRIGDDTTCRHQARLSTGTQS